MLCEGCGRKIAEYTLETDEVTGHWQALQVCETCCHGLEYLRRVYLYRRQREEAWERVGNQTRPGYNRTACRFFDQMNEVLGWNGKHAENGQEKILERKGMPLYPDYFDDQAKIIIEWLEPFHFYNSEQINKSTSRLSWYKATFPGYEVFFIQESWIKKNTCYRKLMDGSSEVNPLELRTLLMEAQQMPLEKDFLNAAS